MSLRSRLRWPFADRLSPLAGLVGMAVFIVAGVLVGINHLAGERQVTVVTANDTLAPGHLVDEDDLVPLAVDRSDADDTFERESDLVGRVVTDEISAGDPVREDDVGSKPFVSNEHVFGLAATDEVTLSEPFVVGDRVDVLLGASDSLVPEIVSDLTIAGLSGDEREGDDDPQLLMLEVDDDQRDALLAGIGRVPMVVVRSCC